MRLSRAVTLLVLIGGAATVLVGCSPDALIWGSEGARVIEVTEQLIGEVAEDGDSALVCADAEVELGPPAHWTGRPAGERARFTGDCREERAPITPQWSINLEGHSGKRRGGKE